MKSLSLLLITLLLAGCSSLSTPEIKGVVVDAETGKPIEDARIFAEWRIITSGPGGRGPGEIKKEIKLKTGPDGRFTIPAHTVRNYWPYPIGQGGFFGSAVIAVGYKGYGCGADANGQIERGECKDITVGKESPIKLTPIRDPKTWLENSGDIIGYVENDKDFLRQHNLIFVDRFGNGKWDRQAQVALFDAYVGLNDYRNAKRKGTEIIEDFQNEAEYVMNTLSKMRTEAKVKEK
jgi:hypothetical protein